MSKKASILKNFDAASVARIPCLGRSYPVPRSLVSRASVARIPCLGRSYPVPRSLVSRACVAQTTCLFPPASWRPARGQVLALARARDGPDVDQVVLDLKRLDRAGSFEIPQGLSQILLEML